LPGCQLASISYNQCKKLAVLGPTMIVAIILALITQAQTEISHHSKIENIQLFGDAFMLKLCDSVMLVGLDLVLRAFWNWKRD
jgi:hypothetical protein